MANTLVLLERVVAGAAGAASVTFANIPQTGYTDLKLVVSARTNYAGINDYLKVTINGNTSSLTQRFLYGSGSAAGSGSYGSPANSILATLNGATSTTSTFGNAELYIPNYASSNYKSISVDDVTETNATAVQCDFYAALWSSASAITTLLLNPYYGTLFSAYSTFSLYGVSNVNTTPLVAPTATGGDIIQTDGTYWYHAFINSGTFTPALGLTCDLLVVAGGGGGGATYVGGGGGAGGLRLLTSQSLSTTQTVTVGAGGTGGGSAYGVAGTNGVNSSIGSISASGGGNGVTSDGTGAQQGGTIGGSGGGGTYTGSTIGAGNKGGYTPVEGYSGGSAVSGGAYGSGGGGGAGAVGNNGTTSIGGAGGIGAGGASYTNYAILDAMGAATNTGVLSSSHYYYAGGGGGSSYGAGGGSNSSGGSGGGGVGSTGQGGAGLANTGGGGGGSERASGLVAGGAGGSGIVIVRYTV